MSILSFHCSYKKNQDKKQNWMMAEVQFSRGIDERPTNRPTATVYVEPIIPLSRLLN